MPIVPAKFERTVSRDKLPEGSDSHRQPSGHQSKSQLLIHYITLTSYFTLREQFLFLRIQYVLCRKPNASKKRLRPGIV